MAGSAMHLSYQCKIGRLESRPVWAKKRDPISKTTRAKRSGVQAVACLSSKFKGLSSDPSIAKRKSEEEKKTMHLCGFLKFQFVFHLINANTEAVHINGVLCGILTHGHIV
jgi:hypothetical protein